MAAGNSINESTTGICGFTGSAFTGTPVTNHALIVGGATSSTLTNLGPTATAGQVLQSAGSSADPVFSTATYPATSGTSGNFLVSDGTNWVSTTSSIPAAPNAALNFYDDFLYASTTAGATATDTQYGPWYAVQSGSTKSITPQLGTIVAGRPGIMTLSTSSAGSTCTLGMLDNNLGNIKMATNGDITATWYFKINTLSDGTNSYTLTMGLTASGGPAGVDGAYFSYTHALNSGQWQCNTSLGGSGTARNSTSTVATGYQVVQLVFSPGVQAAFYAGTTLANLASICTPVATNLPTGQCSPFFRVAKTLGASSVTFDLDLFTLNQTFTTAR
jgi:hypothetical protein